MRRFEVGKPYKVTGLNGSIIIEDRSATSATVSGAWNGTVQIDTGDWVGLGETIAFDLGDGNIALTFAAFLDRDMMRKMLSATN